MREIVIRAGNVAIRARLLDTPTADRIWDALPISAPVQTWGKEVYFRAPVAQCCEPGARDVVSKGEIVFWPDGDSIAIAFGPTPLSKRGEMRLASPCNVWALALDDVELLRSVYAGESVTVHEAERSERHAAERSERRTTAPAHAATQVRRRRASRSLSAG